MLPFKAVLALLASAHSVTQPTQAFSGKWIGSFDVVARDGTVSHSPTLFVFRQSGNKITGTGGSTEHDQGPISEGAVDGQHVTFLFVKDVKRSLNFDLHLEGEHLKGEANGSMLGEGRKALIDVTRLNEHAQSDPLYNEIVKVDAKLFDAFNKRDYTAVKGYFTTDLEFYHDRDGFTDYKQNMEAFQKHFQSSQKVRRELVPDTLEVYPMAHYGAVEIGVHRFYVTDKGKPEELGATAKFVMLWRKKDGAWKISRVISFDHR